MVGMLECGSAECVKRQEKKDVFLNRRETAEVRDPGLLLSRKKTMGLVKDQEDAIEVFRLKWLGIVGIVLSASVR